MKKIPFAAFILILSTCILPAAGAQIPQRRPLIVLSIDGLRPDYIRDADKYGLKIPTLRRLVQHGVYASGVRGVLPTVTYPSHTTMLTGVWPVKHGIYSNTTFDPAERGLVLVQRRYPGSYAVGSGQSLRLYGRQRVVAGKCQREGRSIPHPGILARHDA